MTCLNKIEWNGEGESFVGGLFSYGDDEIKRNSHKNIVSSR